MIRINHTPLLQQTVLDIVGLVFASKRRCHSANSRTRDDCGTNQQPVFKIDLCNLQIKLKTSQRED